MTITATAPVNAQAQGGHSRQLLSHSMSRDDTPSFYAWESIEGKVASKLESQPAQGVERVRCGSERH